MSAKVVTIKKYGTSVDVIGGADFARAQYWKRIPDSDVIKASLQFGER